VNRSILLQVATPVLLVFVAGFLLGFVAGEKGGAAATPALPSDLAAYKAAAVGRLGLDGEQEADLDLLLRYYERERRRLFNVQLGAMEPELADLDRRFQSLIRTHILDADQRRLAAALLHPAPAGTPAADPAAALPAGGDDG